MREKVGAEGVVYNFGRTKSECLNVALAERDQLTLSSMAYWHLCVRNPGATGQDQGGRAESCVSRGILAKREADAGCRHVLGRDQEEAQGGPRVLPALPRLD
jgi:hypothetical protein